MRRPRFRKTQTEVSLFPFLAVLICTMGGLIVLLVMVVQQARVDAKTVAETRRQQAEGHTSIVQLRQGYEDQVWRQETLERQRAAKAEELAEQRLALGHLEEHLRELQQKWKQLVQQAQAADQQQQQQGQSAAARQAELDRLTRAIQQAQLDLDAARKKAASKPRSYTIVPYQGPNGTRRRPIYLECTARGLVIQPAGMVLPLSDLQGPLGPGNPLDAALRAIREYWHQASPAAGEPYPLLLVRPDGVESYAGARAALNAWDDEFGYELIEADLKLEFPPEDAALRPLLEQTVEVARRRQVAAAAAMPSRFEGRSASGFVATSSGGFAALGGSGRSSSTSGGRGIGDGSGGSAMRNRSSSPGRDDVGPGAANRPTSTDPSANGRNSRDANPNNSQPNATGSSSGTANRSTSPAGQSGPAGSPGQQLPGGQPGGSASSGTTQAGPAGIQPGGSVMGGMAGARGTDWGLPNANPRATGVTRPMRVACYPDRLLILPDPGDQRPPQVVLLPESTANGVDAFVSAVWEAMESWGIALAGGYWKPILQVEVQPGAERRFQELEILLKDSGLVVRRKQP